MNISINTPWFSVGNLKLIRNRTAYEKLIGTRIIDALFFLPNRIVKQLPLPSLDPKYHQQTVIAGIEILKYENDFRAIASRRLPFRIIGRFISPVTEQCFLEQIFQLVFFNGKIGYLKSIFLLNQTVWITGKLSYSSTKKTYSIAHPSLISKTSDTITHPICEILYPENTSTRSQTIRSIIHQVLDHIPQLPEWIPTSLLQKNGWPSWNQAIRQAHFPESHSDLTFDSLARKRLIFDELLAQHLTIQIHAKKLQEEAPILWNTSESKKLLDTVPFALTQSQKEAIHEIQSDLQSKLPMLRLLQGDVGSGKTIVALIAAAQAIGSGYQVAFLAPTDILAKQHFLSIQKLLTPLGIQGTLYTGNQKGKERQMILAQVATGDIPLLVGTHALIQDSVIFHRLGLVIIDEQQRFGVTQRFKLAHKTQNNLIPHTLSISATPIPRTLLLSQYSHMKISYLREKPINRQNTITRLISIDRLDELIQSLHRIIDQGQQIYWVCPLIEESETLNLTPAITRFNELKKYFGEKIALIHGQIKNEEKERIMNAFYHNQISILVATTVIEIGVDTPNATVIVIENPERFGLGQLHQLRGRVGRGALQASCILLYGKHLTDIAKHRLSIIRNCTDGFKIAELDLMLRGAGDMFGTQQSGGLTSKLMPNITRTGEDYFQMLQIYTELSTLAAQTAQQILANNQDQLSFAIQTLLNIFAPTVQQEDLRKAG